MKTYPPGSIEFRDPDVVVDADLLASLFDLSVTSLREAMSTGDVSTLVETGEGEDSGRTRLTFRYAGEQVSLMREENGEIYQTTPPSPEVRAVKPSLMQLFEAKK